VLALPLSSSHSRLTTRLLPRIPPSCCQRFLVMRARLAARESALSAQACVTCTRHLTSHQSTPPAPTSLITSTTVSITATTPRRTPPEQLHLCTHPWPQGLQGLTNKRRRRHVPCTHRRRACRTTHTHTLAKRRTPQHPPISALQTLQTLRHTGRMAGAATTCEWGITNSTCCACHFISQLAAFACEWILSVNSLRRGAPLETSST
jgi:hypothetical protein